MAKPTRYTQEMIDEYVSQGYWDAQSLADVFDQNAWNYPLGEAIIDSRTRLTWLQLKQLSDRLALGLLELGIKKDDTMVAELPNWVEHVALRVALLKAGILGSFVAVTFRHTEMERALKALDAVGVVIPWRYRDFDYFQMIKDIRASVPTLRHVFIVGDEVPEGAISIRGMGEQPLEEKYPGDYLQKTRFGPFEVSGLGFTTGTTGMPKICEWPDSVMKLGSKQLVQKIKIKHDDVVGCFCPLSGGSGYLSMFAAPQVAAKLVLLERFEAEEALKLIERERITVVITIPPVLSRILSYPDFNRYDVSTVDRIRTGTAYLPPAVAMEAEERFGCRLVQGVGSTETIGITHSSVDDPAEVCRGTAGKPAIGNEIKMVDDEGKEVPQGEVGELWVRGACVASGIYKNIEATKQAWGELGKEGWFRTGDLARFDEQGNVIIVGRKKDMIIRGGQNIYPAEIEAILSSHPKVSHAVIVGMPDPAMGEKACAYVIPKEGQQFSFDEMTSFLGEHKVAPYKLPERLEIMEKFPMVGDQKVDKRALAADITEKLKAEGKT